MFGPQFPQLWRPIRRGGTPSLHDYSSSADYTFGLKACVVDFFGHDYITKFAPLEDLLRGRVDEIMEEAYKHDATSELYLPYTAGGYKFRWIHIPANNMVWVEEIIKNVCQEKEYRRERTARGRATLERNERFLKPTDILNDKYWKGKQRGCVEGSGAQSLRHMVSSFAEIPTGVTDSKTATLGKPLGHIPNIDAVFSENRTDNETTVNMVLFMPYLHWAVSGESLNYRNALVSEVIENARDPGYIRPTPGEIEQMEHSVDMKILRAFLLPAYDRCLHVPKTLNQYYYSTLTDVDESFRDQVVYKFAMKRHENRMEELARAKEEEKARRVRLRESRRWERDEVSSETRSGSWNGRLVVDVDPEEEDPRRLEPSWDPPKIIMVGQLWMWIIDGDTVITSFPQTNRSALSWDDRANNKDFMEGDDFYDSTDIWRAVQRELRHATNYGQRTAESALDLAWTIADQARGVFQQRILHPQLQFIQMFESEINEITLKQGKALSAFRSNIQAAENVNNLSIGRLIMSLATFQKENFATNQTNAWRGKFSKFAIDFKRKWSQIAQSAQTEPSRVPIDGPSYIPPPLKRTGSVAVISSFLPFMFPSYSEDDDLWSGALKATYNQLEEKIENSRAIGVSVKDIEAQILDCLRSRFEDLETIVEKTSNAESAKKKLNALLIASRKSFELYTEMVLDNLFDITTETYLVVEIEKILEELKMIKSVTHEQGAVMNDLFNFLSQTRDTTNQHYSSATRLEHLKDLDIYVGELEKLAQSTHAALKSLMDLKQKQASVVEARYTRNAAKASSDQAEAATSLGYETVRQGWSIMIFTIVTIIFLPLSFFTGLFGMNAKELLSGDVSMEFYSIIMYPASFAIICVSLGLALNTKFRLLAQLVLRQVLKYTLLAWLWRTKFGFGRCADAIYSAIDREKRRRRAKYEFEKWEIGY